MTTLALETHPGGLRRTVNLLRLYRREPTDPAPFYEFLAQDTLDQLEPYGPDLSGCIVDIGGGPGYLSEALRARGATCTVVEYSEAELHLHGRTPTGAIVGDGQHLPLRDAVADLVHSSNVLEHVPQPYRLLGEMVRVLRPGGLGYLSFTPWLSPWGGHETSPWHYLGGRRAVARFERRTGRSPKNEYGVSLFHLNLPPVQAWFGTRPDVEVLWSGPRYWPPQFRPISRLPILGEVLSWNLLVIFRRRP
jgi:ubiquinone/menaquinone biosynthesis C-methylase UbiE